MIGLHQMHGLVIHGQDHQASPARVPLMIGLHLLLLSGADGLGAEAVESPARAVLQVDGAVESPARVHLIGAVESPARVLPLVIGLLLLGADGAVASPARAVPVHHGLHLLLGDLLRLGDLLLLGVDGAVASPAKADLLGQVGNKKVPNNRSLF